MATEMYDRYAFEEFLLGLELNSDAKCFSPR